MCEDDPDKAECIREVEEAKATPEINDVQQEGKVRALVLKLIGSKGVARGGSWGARDPPLVSLFVSKQPTIFK